MKHFNTIILLFFSHIFMAQPMLERQVFGISGTSVKAESFSLDWTLGEFAIASHNLSLGSLTEGFQQSFVKIETPSISIKKVSDILIMPNPATSFVTVKFLQEPKELIKWELFDITGKSLQTNIFDLSSFHEIDLSNITDGIYILRFSGENTIQTHRIIKTTF
ncbi:MAG: T9SS type A sorting domain-containing protein [Saprospiraceae bacterium]|nr:T9SS type A sorting domain-containing protein [Saprospiraceae bacterium]